MRWGSIENEFTEVLFCCRTYELTLQDIQGRESVGFFEKISKVGKGVGQVGTANIGNLNSCKEVQSN